MCIKRISFVLLLNLDLAPLMEQPFQITLNAKRIRVFINILNIDERHIDI